MKTDLFQFSHRSEEPENSVLYLVGTPIGNINDISKRAINVLKNSSLIICEDTRKTKFLLNQIEVKNKLMSFHQYNAQKKIPQILQRLKNGDSISMVSDAGMPLISDPGEELVKQVTLNEYDVVCIPGPCAAITALTSSGLETSRFVFYGFLARKGKERDLLLKSISKNPFTSIIYESPKRIKELLLDLKNLCGEKRQLSIGRELTKKFEQHLRSDIGELIEYFNKIEPKGEFTIILEGNKEKNNKSQSINVLKNDLISLIDAGLSHSAAAAYLAKKHKKSKNVIYKLII